MNWFLHVVRDNYANFQGRARRQEYWMFVLFQILAVIVAAVIDSVLFRGKMILYTLTALGLLVPAIAVGIRRLHDTDRSGWWLLGSLVPLLNIVVLVFLCLDGTRGPNRFGADPKQSLPPSLPPSLQK